MAKRKSDPKRKRPKRPGRKTKIAKRTKRTKKAKTYNQDRYIIPALRKIWRWYPTRTKVKNRSLQDNGLYKCELCFSEVDHIQIDHIDPIGTCKRENGKTDYNMFIDRLLCAEENLQAICSNCHKQKTKKENHARRTKTNS